jgi:hypothetical protein
VWDSTDAWILQSVVYAGKRGELRSVIANADAINVDIPSRGALERSVQRLQAAGLVKADGDRVCATRAGKRIVHRGGRGLGGIRSFTPSVEAALTEQVAFPHQLGSWTLAHSVWQAAYDSYSRSARG